jgi:Glycoside Hydrolase Family 113
VRKRLNGVAGVGAITATTTLLALQGVSIGRGTPPTLLVVVGGWLFVRGAFLAGAALFTAAEADDHKWRLWIVPLQLVLGFGALYAALWRLDAGSLVGAGFEPTLGRFSLFAATLGAAGRISPESTLAEIALAAEVALVALVVGALVRRLHRRTGWVVGAMVVVAAGGIALAVGLERRLPSQFQRGVSLTGYGRTEYAHPDATRALRAAVDLGAEWVAITPAWYQPTATSHRIRPRPDRTPSARSLEGIIEQARDAHMRVMLKPHLNLRKGTYRGEIEPRDLPRWFAAYERMLLFYADMAQRTGVRQLAVGTELEGVSGHTRRWRRLIARVRGRFDGKLTYAANYDEVTRVEFWDALDLVGVDAYFPLSNDVDATVSDLIEAWKDPVARLERLHERWGRDVLLTELGYPSAESALRTPFEARGEPDTALQERAAEAALAAWAERPWVAGMYWWEWSTSPSEVGDDDRSFALNGKPAADVIEEWYSD